MKKSIVACLIGLCCQVHAQVSSTRESYQVSVKPDTIINYFCYDYENGKLKPRSNNTESSNRYIVRFKSPSEISARLNNERSQVEEDHIRFVKDLSRIESAGSKARSQAMRTVIHHDFKKSFNGKAITSSAEVVDEIRKLPYVHSVVEDKVIRLHDATSNAIIGATQIWDQLGATGEGIVIGIIDTGIDYTHDALGGGMGADYKVVGGYDFVNDDHDPMDDNGHGTHVAGIAAANGATLQGVAPDAKLMAFKVLAKEGYGLDSWILAAIERCLDPDQNPNTDDQPDIVNMSLGRQPDANEPLSEAVNNAVQQGIIFVVAAGNDGGAGQSTIGTPAIARDAITVAATDMSDYTAWFSSKGPTPGTFHLKPDIAAPGVGIFSSMPGGMYAAQDGTSMASPHVAGAAALLLQLNPHWSPEVVKATLMQGAKDLRANYFGGTYFDVGTGRLNALASANATFTVTPASVSVGLLDTSQPVIEHPVVVKVYNHTDQPMSYNLLLEGDLEFPGISCSLSQYYVMVAPNSTTEVEATITVSPAVLPFRNVTTPYLGHIHVIASDGSSVRVPVGLVHTPILKFHFDDPAPQFVALVGLDNWTFKFVNPTGETMPVVLPDGEYDFIASWGTHFDIKENVRMPETGSLSFSKNNASNTIVFQPNDIDGQPIPIRYDTRGITSLIMNQGSGFMTLYFGMVDTLYVSTLSPKWRAEFIMADHNGEDKSKLYSLHAIKRGMDKSEIVSNSNDLVPVKYQFDQIPGTSIALTTFLRLGPFTTWSNSPLILPANFLEYHQRISTIETKYPNNHRLDATTSTGYHFVTPQLIINTDDQVLTKRGPFSVSATSFPLTTDTLSIDLTGSLLVMNANMANEPGRIIVNPTYLDGFYSYALGDEIIGQIKYVLQHDDQIVREGSIINATLDSIRMLFIEDVVPDEYVLTLSYSNHFVSGRFGTATTQLTFNTAQEDRNPPFIENLELMVNDRSGNRYDPEHDQVFIRSSFSDYCYPFNIECTGVDSGVKQINLYYKPAEAVDWIALEGNGYASLPPFLQNGYYSLKVVAEDFHGNSIQHTLEPAFLVGTNPNPVPLVKVLLTSPADKSTKVQQNTVFRWNQVGTIGQYHLQVSTDEQFASLVENVMVNNTHYPTNLSAETKYYWRVRVKIDDANSTWSDVFSFTTGTGEAERVTLLSPADNTDDLGEQLQLTWTSVNANSYHVQASVDSLFQSSSLIDYEVTESTTSITTMPLAKIFWRVRPVYAGVIGEWSDLFRFKAGGPWLRVISPVNEQKNIDTQTQLVWDDDFTGSGDYHLLVSKNEDLSDPFIDVMIPAHTYYLQSLESGTQYYWSVNAQYFTMLPDWITLSETRTATFKTIFPGVQLAEPLNDATDVFTPAMLKWHKCQVCTSYEIMISSDSEFAEPLTVIVQDTAYSYQSDMDGTKTFWRVRGMNEDELTQWSSARNFTTMRVVGVEESPDNRIRIYPNPAESTVTFEGVESSFNVIVRNAIGQVVWQQEGDSSIIWNISDDTPYLNNGIYFVMISTNSGAVHRKLTIAR